MGCKDIILNENSQFYMGVIKRGIHSSVIVGAIDDNHSNHLLCCVGKTNDVDSLFERGNPIKSCALALKQIVSYGNSRLVCENISSKKQSASCSYQAYRMTLAQVTEFYSLITEVISIQSIQYPDLRKDAHIFKAYQNTNDNSVIFKYNKYSVQSSFRQNPKQEEYSVFLNLHITNTCRTTAVYLLERVLKFSDQISKLFFIELDYKTELKYGVPDINNFYILPMPPSMFKEATEEQKKTLELLYDRIKCLPRSNSALPITKEKFDILTELYDKLTSGLNSNTNLVNLINSVINDNKTLFAHRNNNFFTKNIKFKTQTEKLFDKLTKISKK